MHNGDTNDSDELAKLQNLYEQGKELNENVIKCLSQSGANGRPLPQHIQWIKELKKYVPVDSRLS